MGGTDERGRLIRVKRGVARMSGLAFFARLAAIGVVIGTAIELVARWEDLTVVEQQRGNGYSLLFTLLGVCGALLVIAVLAALRLRRMGPPAEIDLEARTVILPNEMTAGFALDEFSAVKLEREQRETVHGFYHRREEAWTVSLVARNANAASPLLSAALSEAPMRQLAEQLSKALSLPLVV